MRAIIHGETHNARSDKKEILGLELDEFDSVFVEHREENFQLSYSPLFLFFSLGYFMHTRLLLPLVDLLSWFYETLKVWKTAEDLDSNNFNKKVKQANLEWEENIDAGIKDFYELMGFERYIALIFTLLIGTWTLIDRRFFTPILVLSTPLIYLAISAVLLNKRGERDEYMANEIVDRSKENNYTSILVICGDRHVKGISNILTDKGWDVKTKRSKNWTRAVDNVF